MYVKKWQTQIAIYLIEMQQGGMGNSECAHRFYKFAIFSQQPQKLIFMVLGVDIVGLIPFYRSQRQRGTQISINVLQRSLNIVFEHTHIYQLNAHTSEKGILYTLVLLKLSDRVITNTFIDTVRLLKQKFFFIRLIDHYRVLMCSSL